MISALLNALRMGSKMAGPAMSIKRALPAAGAAGKTFAGANANRMSATRLLDWAKSPQGVEALALYTPDAIGGVMTAMHTPGDLGDKAIAAVTMGGGSALGGAGARKLLGNRGGQIGRIVADMAGGELGYTGGAMVQDAALRAKGGGTTPYEKLDAQYRQQLEREILAQYGLGGYDLGDLFLQQNGLA